MAESAKLVNFGDESNESIITLNNTSFSIGRSLTCDHIIESLGISRFHCTIKKHDDKWLLFDRSTNGTLVNSILYKFNECVELKDGDIIQLGPNNSNSYTFVTSESVGETQNVARKKNTPPPQLFPNDEVLEQAASLLADNVEDCLEEVVPTQAESATDQPEQDDQKETLANDQKLDAMENELTCSICSELFIKAVTLNCSHTYCKSCIEEWKKTKGNCPICRKHITSLAPTLVLDNFIEKIISMQNKETKETRKVLVQQRQDAEVTKAASSSTSSKNGSEAESVIEVFSDADEDYDDDDEDSEYGYSGEADYDIYDGLFDRPRRGDYYGGYGRCFICNSTGHWANSCPLKRRH